MDNRQRHIFHVSELNRDVRALLESGFPLIWLQGEISNFARPSSGHWYLSLKDQKAQVRCAMFKQKNRLVPFTPENGMQVIVRARVSLYEPRGDFQLIIEHMEESGDGALQRAFEMLKQKLNQEGLFDQAHKKPLPAWPKRVGVITSPSGAAIRDILTTLKRRFPALPVLIYPVPVQGDAAAPQIAHAIAQASFRKECDVLILARGGGSLEDLWPFNEEIVARAVYDCELPIVCGVGHEVDFSIADFVADHRAPTPTAAAEMISPDQVYLQNRLNSYEQQLSQLIKQSLQRSGERLGWLRSRLQHPSRRLMDSAQRVDELEQRLLRAHNQIRQRQIHCIQQLHTRLLRFAPVQTIQRRQDQTERLQQRLQITMQRVLESRQHKLVRLSGALDIISPLATLSRGYSITFKQSDGAIVRDSKQVKKGEIVETKLAKGSLHCVVDKVIKS